MLKRLSEHNKKNGDCIHDENQYLNLIKDILEYGDMVEGRNGFAKTVIGSAMHFSLENGTIPILTTKKVAWKTCLKELLWFIRGSTSNKELQTENVKIWNENASREFLDSRKLYHLKTNDLGPVYGHQWRHFNAPYYTCNDDYAGQGVDQLQYIIDNLKNPETRTSRRLVLTAWNPCQLNEMALPPCHVLVQFNVTNGNRLSCSLYQRSGDVGLGVPFNIASYSFLTHIIAKHCDLVPHEFIYHLGNCHIYSDHLEPLAEQIKRIPHDFPTLNILHKKETIEEYYIEDFELNHYTFHKTIKMEMRK